MLLILVLMQFLQNLSFPWPTQANVVCVVYDVTNEDTINKVFAFYRVYICHTI